MRKVQFWMPALAAAMIVSASSCSSDKKEVNPDDLVNEDNSTFVIAVTAEGSASEATDYVLQSKDLMTGLITPVGQGIEQKSYRMYEVVGKTLLSITYQGTNIVPGYALNDKGILTKKNGEFSILRLHARGVVDENRLFGMFVPRDGSAEATFYEINASNMRVDKQAKINVFEAANNGKEWAYFNDVRLVGNKVFAPFFQIRNSSFDTEYADSAYLAIYSYPELKLEKVIKDDRTGTLGRYASNDVLAITESGDVYTYSAAGAIAAGNVPSSKPSGILRIKNGTTDFDKDYFFNIETATGGYKLCAMKYIGGGKALAQIFSFKDHVAGDKWTNRDCRLAIIDFSTKTITDVAGVPLHTGGSLQYGCVVDKTVAYLQVQNGEGIHMYKVDLATAKGTKGAKVQGKAVMGLFKMTK
ncbi:DUF4374 domain-containing protein [Chitinophaga sp.]|uniref:DUF4374 domain-containing protein n=1 Tax=Chitinophaga sp. TaxID=1869181 RepID=UPI00262E2025|nr:DUF4374 domain-containing protein [uncultured Chitinophaga sp.]